MMNERCATIVGAILMLPSMGCLEDEGPRWNGFVDRSEGAGVATPVQPPATIPDCLLDDVRDQSRKGDFCLPEHMLGAFAVGDYDDDGWPDVFVSRRVGPDRLLHNRGDGTFEDVAASAGIEIEGRSGAAAWLDVEGDGDLDLFVTVINGYRYHLFVNDGTGLFDDEALDRGAALETSELHVGMGVAVGDYDRDGYVDLFVTEWSYEPAMGPKADYNRLLHNRGAAGPGTFEDVTDAAGIDLRTDDPRLEGFPGVFGFAPAFVDLDDDQWPELAISADFGTSKLYANDQRGGFIDITEEAGVGLESHGMGSTFGDYDGDGDLDWFVSSISPRGVEPGDNRLYRNDGNLAFTDVAAQLGVGSSGWGWGATFFDADLDADLDLAVAAGWNSLLFRTDPLMLWTNDGEEPWARRDEELGVSFERQGRGLVTIDHDRDGDLELLVGSNLDAPALYDNDVEGRTWLGVRLRGRAPNTEAIGARVRVRPQAGGPWQVRQIGVGSHFHGQAEALAHFGLGADTTVELEIIWPTSGQTTRLHAVEANQVLEIREPV
ncbi:MAG: CRTAC1 family protein [Deltaproteobacteria bacterium]|nr:CRTAC1 family protein [Deltaproteobacteria bacterium]